MPRPGGINAQFNRRHISKCSDVENDAHVVAYSRLVWRLKLASTPTTRRTAAIMSALGVHIFLVLRVTCYCQNAWYLTHRVVGEQMKSRGRWAKERSAKLSSVEICTGEIEAEMQAHRTAHCHVILYRYHGNRQKASACSSLIINFPTAFSTKLSRKKIPWNYFLCKTILSKQPTFNSPYCT